MKVEIDIDIPDGYAFVRYGFPKEGETYLSRSGHIFTATVDYVNVPHFIIRKIQPRRRIFECVSEEPRQASRGEMVEAADGDLVTCKSGRPIPGKYKIWKEVTGDEI